jgi:hypothetical protein
MPSILAFWLGRNCDPVQHRWCHGEVEMPKPFHRKNIE